MKISEVISRGRKDLNVSSDDSSISGRYIYFSVRAARNEIIRQEIEKKGIWNNFEYQTLRMIEFNETDISELEHFNSGYTVLKSKISIPDILDVKTIGKIVNGLFLPTGQRIDMVTYRQFINDRNRRFVSPNPVFFLRNSHAYIGNYKVRTKTLFGDIDALYEFPEEVEKLNHISNPCNSCVYYPDMDAHIPGYLENAIFRKAKLDIAWRFNLPTDNTNDANDNTNQIRTSNGENTG